MVWKERSWPDYKDPNKALTGGTEEDLKKPQ